jgi:hypothetical protein
MHATTFPALKLNAHGPRAITVTVVALTMLASGGALADDATRAFLRCMELRDDAARLACYDRLAGEWVELGAPGLRSAPAAAPAGALPPAAIQGAPPLPVPETPAAATSAAPVPATPRSVEHAATETRAPMAEEYFGMESRAVGESLESISAYVVGGFRGWSGNTQFELSNGQVWEQATPGRFDYGAADRAVTIRRGVFGSFILSPEGLNRNVRVRRVR